jgi:hypothetical protein
LSCSCAPFTCSSKILVFLASKSACVICFRRLSFYLIYISLLIIFILFELYLFPLMNGTCDFIYLADCWFQ